MIDFLLTCGSLKRTKRTGWVDYSVKEPESIADHMHRMAVIAMQIEDESINTAKVVRMAVVHDLAEALVGDITPTQGIPKETKFKMELAAMDSFVDQLNSSKCALEMKALWLEYEAGATAEAMLCKDIDKFEMILQAYEYELAGSVPLDPFYDGTTGKFRHPQVKAMVEDLLQRRTCMLQERV